MIAKKLDLKDINVVFQDIYKKLPPTYEKETQKDVYTPPDVTSAILNLVYPVNSIMCVADESYNPNNVEEFRNANFEWRKIENARVIQSSDSQHRAGDYIEAGLPNIEGFTGVVTNPPFQPNGAFIFKPRSSRTGFEVRSLHSTITLQEYWLDASKANEIYGNSDTVQPSAFAVVIWRRVK